MVKLIKILGTEDDGTLKGEVFTDDVQTAELYQPEGFHHIPEPDTEGLMLLVGGQTSHQVVVLPRNLEAELDNPPGDTVLYGLKDKTIQTKLTLAGDGTAKLETPKATLSIAADGGVSVSAERIALNGDGTSLVTYKELQEGLGDFVAALIADLERFFPLAMQAGVTYKSTLKLDISKSEAKTVRTGKPE